VQIGYLDAWRLQMGAPGDAVREFHDWWGSLVSGVAYAPRVAIPADPAADQLPLPAIVNELGIPKREVRTRTSRLLDPRVLLALFILLMFALPLETASRRLRGKS